MNYCHAYHAGNFADVLKHTALMCVLLHLRKKEKPFAVIDTHAGRGIYDIGGMEAQKTGEAAGGIMRLLLHPSVPRVLSAYLDIVRKFGEGWYPGSPLIAAQMLRQRDRLTAIELRSGEHEELVKQLRPFSSAEALHGDGYRELLRLIPPRERRGLILIDPPYEEDDEFVRAADVLVKAHRRFATGVYMLWYPARELPKVSATIGELVNAGIDSLVRIELDVGVKSAPHRHGRGPPMTATGLLVVNPPFGFTSEMQTFLPFLSGTLAQAPGASSQLDVVATR